jgi:hypothetical protein
MNEEFEHDMVKHSRAAQLGECMRW